MPYRFVLALCLLCSPALAQNKPSDNAINATQTKGDSVHKGRPQPMERHTRTTWRYHSGAKRSSDSTAKQKPAGSNDGK